MMTQELLFVCVIARGEKGEIVRQGDAETRWWCDKVARQVDGETR
jgi:hypothetical protein